MSEDLWGDPPGFPLKLDKRGASGWRAGVGGVKLPRPLDLVLLWKTAGLPSGSYVRDLEAAVARGFREVPWEELPSWGLRIEGCYEND